MNILAILYLVPGVDHVRNECQKQQSEQRQEHYNLK